MADIYAPEFTNEEAAIAHLEQSRWADGVVCPHCGSVSVTKMAGQTQAGYFQCNDCRDKFTCRTGTVMERSHIPVHKSLLAIHLLSASKKGMSAHQLHRMLGVTYKSAWFLGPSYPRSHDRRPRLVRLVAKANPCRPMRLTTAIPQSARTVTRRAIRTSNRS